MKTSITFYPNKLKRNTKTGQVPIYMRVQLGKTKAETRLNADLKAHELLLWEEATQRIRDRRHSINGYLSTLEKKYEDFRIQYADKLWNSDPRTIRDFILGIQVKQSPKIMDYVDNYYNTSVHNNAQLATGTKINYRKAIKHLRNFLTYSNTINLRLENLTTGLALNFKDYLLNAIPELEKQGMTEVSALGIVKKFRSIFDRAVDEEILNKNPFKKIKLKNQSPVRDRLDIHQIKQLYDLDFSEFPPQRLYRDLFLFSVFTGLAYKDFMALKQSNISLTVNGNYKLSIIRAKTGIATEMVLSSYSMNIIKRYEDSTEVQVLKTLFPRRSNKEVNIQLKILAGMARIAVKLTCHVARHSFRQLLAEAGVQEIGVVKLMMGHSRRSDIDGIYHQVTVQSLITAKEKLESFLKIHLQ